MTNRSFVILAVALAEGLGVTFSPDALEHFPGAFKSILESGIATGSLLALVLNLILPKAKPIQTETNTAIIPNESNVEVKD